LEQLEFFVGMFAFSSLFSFSHSLAKEQEPQVKSSEVIYASGFGSKQPPETRVIAVNVGIKSIPVAEKKGLSIDVIDRSTFALRHQFDTHVGEAQFLAYLAGCSEKDILTIARCACRSICVLSLLLIVSCGDWEASVALEYRKALSQLCTPAGKSLFDSECTFREQGKPFVMIIIPHVYCRYSLLGVNSVECATLEVPFKYNLLKKLWCPLGTFASLLFSLSPLTRRCDSVLCVPD
jgi:hypothetical protein